MKEIIAFLNTGLGTALAVLIMGGLGSLGYGEYKESRKRKQEILANSAEAKRQQREKADRLRLIRPRFNVECQNMGGSTTSKGLLQVIELKLINHGGRSNHTKIETDILEAPINYGLILPSADKSHLLRPKEHGFWCSLSIKITGKNQDGGEHVQVFSARWDDNSAKYVVTERPTPSDSTMLQN